MPLATLSEPFFKQLITSPSHRDGELLDHTYTRKIDDFLKRNYLHVLLKPHGYFIQITVPQISDSIYCDLHALSD